MRAAARRPAGGVGEQPSTPAHSDWIRRRLRQADAGARRRVGDHRHLDRAARSSGLRDRAHQVVVAAARCGAALCRHSVALGGRRSCAAQQQVHRRRSVAARRQRASNAAAHAPRSARAPAARSPSSCRCSLSALPPRRRAGARERQPDRAHRLAGVPPPGPAMPVTATARSRRASAASAPCAIARATGSLTAPCCGDQRRGDAEQLASWPRCCS